MAASTAPHLFPIVPPHRDTRLPSPTPPEAAERTGIARLASSSPLAGAKRGAEYFLLPAALDSEPLRFRAGALPLDCQSVSRVRIWMPVLLCALHARVHGSARADFERKIFVKENAGPLAARDLRSLAERGEPIAIGTATDPYQPAEREFGATRAILEQMAGLEGLSVSITTKSNQVLRDVDLLQRIAAHSTLQVNLTVTTHRARLARLLEPRAPRPDSRLAAVRELRDAGLAAGVFVMPGASWTQRSPGRSRSAGASGAGCGRAVVRGEGTLSDALGARAILPVPGAEVSEVGPPVSRMVPARERCAGILPARNQPAGGGAADEIRSGGVATHANRCGVRALTAARFI